MTKSVNFAITAVLSVPFVLIGLGCGSDAPERQNRPVTSANGNIQGRWVNRTSMPDSVAGPFFERKLLEARAELYRPQVDLYGNPVRAFTTGEQACMQSVEPRDWAIVGLQSVPASELNALPTCLHCPYVDPTPFVYCPDNPDFKYCNAYLHDGAVFIPDAFPEFIGPWELDNRILDACHVDIGPR